MFKSNPPASLASESLSDPTLRSPSFPLRNSDITLSEPNHNIKRGKLSNMSSYQIQKSNPQGLLQTPSKVEVEVTFNYLFENQIRVYIPGGEEDKKILRLIDLHM